MARTLNENEKEIYITNRDELHVQLSELQADLEDLTNEELMWCRGDVLERINLCLKLILETDDDNCM